MTRDEPGGDDRPREDGPEGEGTPTASVDPARSDLVRELRARGALVSPEIEEAFLRIPREGFVGPDGGDPEGVYQDRAIVTERQDGRPVSSSSQPSLMARMLESLDLERGMRVLEIGGGTGYNAALVAHLVGPDGLVVTVEYRPGPAARSRRAISGLGIDNVHVVDGDGFEGAPGWAPFDRLVVTAGCPDLSPHWVEQLDRGGVMLVPLEHAGHHALARLGPRDGAVAGRVVGWTGFMSMEGTLAACKPWRRSIALWEDDIREGLATGAVRELPLWDGFGADDTGEGLGEIDSDHTSLFFLLSVLRSDLTWTPWGFGVGLADDDWALVDDARLLARGGGALTVLERAHARWRGLGAPSIRDYELHLEPVGKPAVPHGDDLVLERHWFRQHLRPLDARR